MSADINFDLNEEKTIRFLNFAIFCEVNRIVPALRSERSVRSGERAGDQPTNTPFMGPMIMSRMITNENAPVLTHFPRPVDSPLAQKSLRPDR